MRGHGDSFAAMTGIEFGIQQIGAEMEHAIVIDPETGTLFRTWFEWGEARIIQRAACYPDKKICCLAMGYDSPELRDSVPPSAQ